MITPTSTPATTSSSSSSMPSQYSSTNLSLPPSFTTLPPELRDQIYTFLTPPTNPSTSQILASRIGVASVSHTPPPLPLLLTSKQCYSEACDTYYRRARFTIERAMDTTNLWTMWGVEDVLGGDVGKSVLRRMRRVEVGVFWHWLPSKAKAFTLAPMSGEIVVECVREKEVKMRIQRIRRVTDVLRRAANLRFMSLTWKEVAPLRVEGQEEDEVWELEARRRVLEPLRSLGGVQILDGDIIAADTVERNIKNSLAEIGKYVESAGYDQEQDNVEQASSKLRSEDKKTLDGLFQGDGQYLLTPEERAAFNRKPSYFE